ncbi:MAG: cob(I)yrinic acid a,c-diamide adenosyltransferase [Desulfosalsimonadaceae bacterium]
MQKGYVQIYTGDGKGKTTAALGLAIRAAGAGMHVYIGQFMKQGCYNELESLKRFSDRIAIEQFGTGQYVFGKPSDEDRAAAAKAWAALSDAVMSGKYDVVIMEEANVALGFGLITEADLLRMIDEKPEGVELVITGRGATPALIEKADLVTEMRPVKHYYEKGVLARTGIES